MKDGEGNLFFGTSIMNPNDGSFSTEVSPIGGGPSEPVGDLQVVGPMGLTADESVRYYGDKAGASAQGKSKAEGQEGRRQDVIASGISAAQALPNLKRTLDLLDKVQTGGYDKWRLQIKNTLGIESADEAEATNRMAKAVLSQLRETFGPQFTAVEGQKLEDIEAGIGKSTAGNKRIIEQLMAFTEFKLQQGMNAAKNSGDFFSYQQMQDWEKFDLPSYAQPANETTAGGGSVVNWRDL